GLSYSAHGVVLPFDENCCGGLGSPVGSRPLSFAMSGRVDGFTSHAKLPFLSLMTMLLSRWSVIVRQSCDVGRSNVFVSLSTDPFGAWPASTECLVGSAVFCCAR